MDRRASLKREVVGFFGATGTGKTQAARSVMASRGYRRICILDPMADYDTNDVEAVCESRDEVREYLDGFEEGENFSFCYRPPAEDPEPEAAGFLARIAYAAGDCALVLDEAHISCNYHDCSPHVLIVTRRGRHKRVSVLLISQRPADVHPALRAEAFARETYIFRLARKDDLREIALERGNAFAESVARLPDLQCYRIRPEGTDRGRIEFVRNRPVIRIERPAHFD